MYPKDLYTHGMADVNPEVAAELAACVDALLAATRALVGAAARSVATLDGELTLVQWRALVLLDTRGPMRARALAEHLGMRPASVTGLCDRLEEKQLVRREAGTADRREVVVALSTRGRRLVRDVMRRRRRDIERLVARIEPDQCAAIVEAAAALVAVSGDAPDDAWRFGWLS